MKRRRTPANRRPVVEMELFKGTTSVEIKLPGVAHSGQLLIVSIAWAGPLFRRDPPPSAKTSSRGGRSCAAAQEQTKQRSKTDGEVIRLMMNTSLEFENSARAGDNVMAGSNKTAGLAADVVSELQSQSQVPLQHDVGPTSVVPDEP